MPCSSDGYDARENEERKAQLDRVTALLCALCEQSTGETIHRVPGLVAWWEEHQRIDAERKRHEIERAEREQLAREEREAMLKRRHELLATMSQEDLDALGVSRGGNR